MNFRKKTTIASKDLYCGTKREKGTRTVAANGYPANGNGVLNAPQRRSVAHPLCSWQQSVAWSGLILGLLVGYLPCNRARTNWACWFDVDRTVVPACTRTWSCARFDVAAA